MSGTRKLLISLVLTAALAAPGSALAATGGAPADVKQFAAAESGGSQVGDPSAPTGAKQRKAAADRKRRAELRAKPVITGAKLSPTTLLDQGRPLKLRYRVKATAKRVRVRLIVRTLGGKYVKTLDLGVHRTKVLQSTELTQAELGVNRAGNYRLRLIVRDPKGRRAARAAGVQTWLRFSLADHRFPLVGQFSFGGADSRFGVGRPGHTHQGQDLSANSGTPIVAPYAGKVSWVNYQADGAGYYVVLDANDGRDYVFMHMLKGSVNVKQGDVVPTGKLLGRVGSTGSSSGPHLHFEIWTGGPWQFGGKPVDPLPLLESWYANAPGGAVKITSAAAAAAARSAPLD